MSNMKIFRILVSSLIIVIASIGCNEKNKDENNAQEIVNKAIEVSGGEKIKSSVISFQFRDRHYKATRNNGEFILERRFQDSTKVVTDRLYNSGFKRFINGQQQNLQDSIAAKYGNSVNSVHYFSVLPYGLNDAAVNKKYLEQTKLMDKKYHKIKITFDEVGGGEDFDDVFIYWIGKESNEVDYLAYSFNENDGVGMRFRKAYNERYIEGIRFVDYDNYKPTDKATNILELDKLFEHNKLELLSKIELKNVEVKLN